MHRTDIFLVQEGTVCQDPAKSSGSLNCLFVTVHTSARAWERVLVANLSFVCYDTWVDVLCDLCVCV